MNLLDHSENFGEWTVVNSVALTANQTDPLGGQNAYLLQSTTTSGNFIYADRIELRNIALSAGQNYTASVYIKQGPLDGRLRVQLYDDANSTQIGFVDVDFSSLGVPSTVASTSATNINYEAIGSDGWYRMSFTSINTTATADAEFKLFPDRQSGNDDVYVYGAMLEETVYSSTSPATEKVTNGTFTADRELYWDDDNNSSTAGWWNITNPSASSVSNGRAILDSSTGTADARQDVPVTAGKQYVISVTMSVDSGGQGVFFMSDGANYSYAFGSWNATETETTFTKTVVPTQNIIRLYPYAPSSTGKAYYSDISIKEYDPVLQAYTQTPVVSDAHNSTSATNLREFAGKENLVSSSEDFSSYLNVSNRFTVENLTGTTPIGNTYSKLTINTSDSVEKNFYTTQNIDIKAGETYVVSVYARNNSIVDGSGENKGMLWLQRIGSGAYEGSGITIPVSSEWQRVSVSHTFANDQTGLQAKVLGLAASTEGSIEVTGYQVNFNTLKEYHKTTGSHKTADCMVVNWYDQGGGEDFTQSTTDYQPRIVRGSELVTDSGGKASVYFDDADHLDNDSLAGQNRLDSYTIQDTNDTTYVCLSDPNSVNRYGLAISNGSSLSYLESGFGLPSYYVNGALQSFTDRDDAHDVLTGKISLVSQHNASTGAWTGLIVGQYHNGTTSPTYNFTGKISEMVFFPNMDSSPKRFPIEQNMLNHFDVNLVTNGTFDTDSDWSKNSGWTIANGKATKNSGDVNYITNDFSELGYLEITYTISDYVSGDVKLRVGTGFSSNTRTANGTYTEIINKDSATFGFYGSGQYSVDNVTVKLYGTDGFINTLYDQTGNNCHALQSTAAYQPQIVSGGDLIKSGNHPAWEHVQVSNMELFGKLKAAHLDAWFVVDTAATRFLYPANYASTGDHGFVSQDGSTSTGLVADYGGGNEELYVNGTLITGAGTTRDEVHTALNGRKLAHHQDADTADWGQLQMGRYGSSSTDWFNFEGKFSEWIWYDSDQSSNRTGIEENINSHYNIYS
jgi:hypothetical protein